MKIIKNIATQFLILLVLVSSTSFSIGMHFCMGQIQNVALFSKAKGCLMEQKMPPCHRQHTKAPCCEDETLIHEGDDLSTSTTPHYTLNAPDAIDLPLPPVFISEIVPSVQVSRTRFFNYDPPLRSGDLTVAHRTFLI